MSGNSTAPVAPWPVRPVVALAGRLSTAWRLAALVLALLVPAVYAGVSYGQVEGEAIAFSRAEIDGTSVVRPALAAAAAALAGQAVPLDDLAQAVAAVPGLALDDELAVVRSATGADGAEATAAVLGALAAFVTEAGNVSNLVLDPDLDSFYVMDAQVVQVPRLLGAVAGTQALVEGSAEVHVADLAVLTGTVDGAATALAADVATAVRTTSSATLAEDLAPASALASAGADLAAALARSLDVAAPGPAALAALEGARPALADAAAAAGEALVASLDTLLAARIADLEGRLALRVGTIVVFTVVALLLGAAVWWRTTTDVRLTLQAVLAVAEGDFTARPLPSGRDEMARIGEAVDRAREQLAANAEDLERARVEREERLAAQFMAQRQAERQSRERAQAVVDDVSEHLSGVLAHMRSRVDEVRRSAGVIDERVRTADDVTRAVVASAGRAEQVAADLDASLRKVSGMAHLIAGVAEQTKLLALNATIEAARAGSAGRGFSVVANEVKELAQTTGRSTDEISSTVQELSVDAAAMSTTIGGITGEIGGVHDATAVLGSVAADQIRLVGELEEAVQAALERLGTMEALTKALERRESERIGVTGEVQVRLRGTDVPAALLDLSDGGLRCHPRRDVQVSAGDRLQVRLDLGGRHVQVDARVARVGARGELGVQFVDVPADVTQALRAYVAQTVATLETAAA